MATYWENSCSFGLRNVLWYKYLIVGLGFSHLGFWSGNLSLIAPFPDLCLLVPFYHLGQFLYEPLREKKKRLRGFRPGLTQNSMYVSFQIFISSDNT